MGEYTVAGLKSLGYRGYIRDRSGMVREDERALTKVAMLANFNRYHLMWEMDRNGRTKRIHVRSGLFAENEDIWIEKELI